IRLMAFSDDQAQAHLARRHMKARMFRRFCAAITWAGVFLLAVLLIQISIDGFAWLDWQFINSYPSRFPERAGIKSALVGTLYLIVMIAVISVPVGISAALYLEEFSGKGRIAKIIEVNIANLSGVPSIVYGDRK